jgi:hypothetical protein
MSVTDLWLMTAAVFVVAGFVKGVLGMGLPTVAMGLLSLGMPPVEAATVLIVPSFITNVWQFVAGPNRWAMIRRLWSMMLGVVLGTVLTAGIMVGNAAGTASRALGIALIAYAVVGLAGFSLTVDRRREVWLSPVVGLATGLVTGATGVFVLPAVPYLQGIGFAKDDLVQALGLSFTVSTIALAAVLPGAALQTVLGWLPLGCVAVASIGMVAGQIVRQRLAGTVFRRVFFVGLLLLGAHLALR